MAISKDELIKALDEAGYRESALNLQNWNEMDDVASLVKSTLERRINKNPNTRAQSVGTLVDHVEPGHIKVLNSMKGVVSPTAPPASSNNNDDDKKKRDKKDTPRKSKQIIKK